MGHALLHIGIPEADRQRVTQHEDQWPEVLATATDWYKALDPGLNERLAQLLTHHGLGSLKDKDTLPAAQIAIDRIAETFEKLTRRTPAQYQIDMYTSVPKERVVTSIGLLKERTLIGASAWETVIKW